MRKFILAFSDNAFRELLRGAFYFLTDKEDNPNKEFYPASERAVCPNMKRTTQEKILWALEELKEEVKVPEEIRLRAKKAIDRMLEIV